MKSGFDIFNIYNLGEVLRAINNNEIQNVGIHQNPDDGKKAIYFRLDDLEDFVVWKIRNGQCNLFDF